MMEGASDNGMSTHDNPRAARGAWLRRWADSTPLVAGLLAAVAFAVRAAGLSRSFELWVDEMVYANVGADVSRGHLPELADHAFLLHPPGFFLIEGAVLRALGLHGDDMTLVYDLRWINATLGAASVGLLFVLLRGLAPAPVAVWGGALMAFDPFILRQNSRVLIETAAGTAVIGGLLVLAVVLRQGRRTWRPWILPLLSGLLLGCAVLCKDAFLLYTAVPVGLSMWWRRTVPIRVGATVLAGLAVPYAGYLVLLAARQLLDNWWHAKIGGAQRLLGLVQTTGFNAPQSPSLIRRGIDQISWYGTSYVLLAACLVAGVFAAMSRRADRRLIGVVATVAGAGGVYAAAFGTLEEHFGYVVAVAGIAALAVGAAELLERRPPLRRTVWSVTGILLVLTMTLGVRVEVTRDNGFQRARDWFAANLPAGARVGVTNSTAEWAFGVDPRFGKWPTVPALRRAGAHYVITADRPTREGYGYANARLLDWLRANARPVFRAAGPTNGELVIWYIDDAALDRGAAAGIGT